MEQSEGEPHGRMADVLPANIERPGDRIERGHHRRVEPLRLQPVGDHFAFLDRALPGQRRIMDGHHRVARRGLAGPRGVDWVRSEEHTTELQSLMRTSYA